MPYVPRAAQSAAILRPHQFQYTPSISQIAEESFFDAPYSPMGQLGGQLVGQRAQSEAALDALRNVARTQRMLGQEAQQEADYDLVYRMPRRAGAQADIEDLLSERTARRAFLPEATRLHQRERFEAGEDLTRRFVEPMIARYGAEADRAIQTARLQQEGLLKKSLLELEAAQRRAMLEGLWRAVAEMAKTGKIDPKELQTLTGLLALGQPQAR
jgi:hypothetical protein